MNYKDKDFKRLVIMDHYKSPRHKPLYKDNNSKIIRKNNNACMDDIVISLNINNNKVVNGSFEGIACALTNASADILIDLIINKSIKDALDILKKYKEMIKNGAPCYEELKEALVFHETHKQANRLNCVLMAAEGLEEILKGKNYEIK